MEHYLDNAATTRVSDAAAQAALAAMTGEFGNPSSRHEAGTRAAQALKEHRAVIAGALGAKPEEMEKPIPVMIDVSHYDNLKGLYAETTGTVVFTICEDSPEIGGVRNILDVIFE